MFGRTFDIKLEFILQIKQNTIFSNTYVFAECSPSLDKLHGLSCKTIPAGVIIQTVGMKIYGWILFFLRRNIKTTLSFPIHFFLISLPVTVNNKPPGPERVLARLGSGKTTKTLRETSNRRPAAPNSHKKVQTFGHKMQICM